MKREITKILMLSFFIFQMFFLSSTVYAQTEEEKNFLLMYFKEDELEVISATRSLKSITQVAENVSVITAEDIELMNAHTLTDVLNTITGVQVDIRGGLGGWSMVSIQGSFPNHVVAFIDGISITSLSDSSTLPGDFPVQFIEKIEIIKGPASSTWGSSLGGVINVITKSPGKEEKIKGTLYASYGKDNTGDLRAEAYGRKNNFGYYVYAGRLQSDGLPGLRDNMDFSGNDIFTKLSYDMSRKTSLLFTVLYNKNKRGDGKFTEFDFSDSEKTSNFLSSLSLKTSLNDNLDLIFSLRRSNAVFDFEEEILSTGDVFKISTEDNTYGANAKLTWKYEKHNIVVGSDYDNGTTHIISDKKRLIKFAVFANDTIILNKFSVTPGIRYDDLNISGGFLSPSIGITYEISDNMILRAFVARGFSIPILSASIDNEIFFFKGNPDLDVEKVWSYQLGVETGILKYLWLKVSAFRHEISDVIVDKILSEEPLLWTKINKGDQRRQGIEIEMKTAPFYNTTFSAGTTFIKITGSGTDSNMPKYTYDLGLEYNDKKSLRAVLKGHYIWWMNNVFNGDYDSFVFDFNVIKSIYKKEDRTLEAFLTAHNIFNASQYAVGDYKNPKRWIEGGLRYKF
jgi:vitamin B12 transporter